MSENVMDDNKIELNEILPTATPHPGLPALSKTYHAGTLTYTKMGLVMLFIWLLWGDFCFTLMETIIPSILPLKLKSLDAPNFVIALFMSTIPGILNATVCPAVSYKSDRYRSPMGRRIPFLLYPTPLLCLFLVLLGFSDSLGGSLHRILVMRFTHVSPTFVTLCLMAVLIAGFQFFNMFVASVYYYLFNDVVPQEFLSRFMSLFSVVGTGSIAFYNMFIYKHALTHMKEIFLVTAGLYFVSFMIMCWKIREGEYPPPENQSGTTGILASIKTYFKECFTHPYYLDFFLGTSLWAMSGCIGTFAVFLNLSLGLDLGTLGKIAGWAGLAGCVLAYPAGYLADRWHPIRMVLVTEFAMVFFVTPISFIYLFYNFTPHTVLVIAILVTFGALPLSVVFRTANLPMYMTLLPKDRYGQFCSAQAIFNSIAVLIGGLGAGAFMDLLKHLYNGNEFYYRYIPCWSFLFQLLSLIFMYKVYRGWKKYGGPDHYCPPEV
jgi:hypothetical protein